MGKFYGKIGYAEQVETTPGVWQEKIVERNYYGDVVRDLVRSKVSENLNDNLIVENRFSIVADPYAYELFFNMRYVVWMGAKWKISAVEVQRPRLILTIGGLYNEQGTSA